MKIFWHFSTKEWQAMEAPFPKFGSITEVDKSRDVVF
jgi:hypothetical protein